MSTHIKYKPTGNELIGEIPEHWKLKRLKNLVSPKITDGPHETPELVDDADSVPFISAEAITELGIDYDARGGNISLEQDKIYSQKCKPQRNDIFIVKSGSTTGRIGYVETDMNFNIWSPLALVRSNKQTSSRFLFYHLSSDSSQRQIQNTWSFGTQPNIGMGVIERLQIALPSPEEQRTIATYLDEQTQKIDTLIANKKAQAEKLKELRQIEINNAVTKGLNKNVELKESGIEWLGNVPKHWEIKRLKNVTQYIQTGATPPSEKSEYYEGEIPWYGPGGFSGDTVLNNPVKYITQKAIDDKEGKLFPVDCIFMIGIGATIGKIGIIKEASSCNQQLNIIRFTNSVNPDFGVYFLKLYEGIIINIANASTLPIYNQEQTGNLNFALPPKEEQIEIAKHLQQRTAAIDKLIKNTEAQIEKLQEFRKIKIFEAVTGKIKVNAHEQATA